MRVVPAMGARPKVLAATAWVLGAIGGAGAAVHHTRALGGAARHCPVKRTCPVRNLSFLQVPSKPLPYSTEARIETKIHPVDASGFAA